MPTKIALETEGHVVPIKAKRMIEIGNKALYLISPLAGHEYDVYHLNEIMAFFDKYCK